MAKQKYATMPTQAYINLRQKGFQFNQLDDLSQEFKKKAGQRRTRPLYKKILAWLSEHVLGIGQQKLDPAVFGHARLWPKEKAKAMKIQKIYGFIRAVWKNPNKQTKSEQLIFHNDDIPQKEIEVWVIRKLAPDLQIVATNTDVGIYCNADNFLWFSTTLVPLISDQDRKKIQRFVDYGAADQQYNKAVQTLQDKLVNKQISPQAYKVQKQKLEKTFYERIGETEIKVSQNTIFPPLSHIKFDVMIRTLDVGHHYGSKIDYIYKRIIEFSESYVQS